MRAFAKLCQKTFHFLEKAYGFKLSAIDQDAYGVYLTYTNPTTAIVVSFEPREGGIFTRVIKLVDGKIPSYPITIEESTLISSYYIEDIIALRGPPTKMEQPPIDDLRNISILSKVLTQHASALRTYAADILKGDFTLFPQLEQIVKKRAAELKR